MRGESAKESGCSCMSDSVDVAVLELGAGCMSDLVDVAVLELGAGCTSDSVCVMVFELGAGCTSDPADVAVFELGAGCTSDPVGDDLRLCFGICKARLLWFELSIGYKVRLMTSTTAKNRLTIVFQYDQEFLKNRFVFFFFVFFFFVFCCLTCNMSVLSFCHVPPFQRTL